MSADDETPVTESVDSFLVEMVKTPGAGTATALAPGTVIDDQYRLERALGQGGMGVVYLARDLRLDRDVALKLGHVVDETALGRIEREAVALARLQHPNVVVIHQVGEIAGRLYIAMEYVDGGNAREWLAAVKPKRRGWREIVAMYTAAGDGLAAAHAAGFVHRDFKPDNVLVGSDGRPRVADFGLVRGVVAGEEERGSGTGTGPGTGADQDRMTKTGAVMGTPAYMAPEQLGGDDLDARADQFAFCAALWEALFESRPYRGRTPAEVAAAIETTQPRPPADGASVPRSVIAALRRGLDRDRDARWPSMAALLGELRRDPRTRRRIALIAVGTAAIAGGAAVLLTRAAAADPCRDGDAIIARTWSPARAAQLAGAFERVGLRTSWDSLRGGVDHYAAAWAVAHDDACRATRVDGSQSEAMMDRRVLCLDRARDQLEAILGGFGEHDRTALVNAGAAMTLLPDLARCADVTALGNQTALPADAAARAKITAASKLVDQAKVASVEGWQRDPRAIAERALTEAEAAGWPPLIAQASLARAEVLQNMESPDAVAPELERTARLGLAAGDDEVSTYALADLASARAQVGRSAEATTFVELARALWTRMRKPPAVGVRVELATGEIALVTGDYAGALDATRRQIALAEIAFPDDAYDRADNHFNLANALEHLGRLDEARREIDVAVRIVEASTGPDHPMMVGYLVKAAEIAGADGRIDDAITAARRAVAIAQGSYRPDDVRLGDALGQLGIELGVRGDPNEARDVLERAMAIGASSRGKSRDHFGVMDALAVVEDRTGHPDRAVEIVNREVAEVEQMSGHDSPDLMVPLLTRGIALRGLGRLDESRADLERVVGFTDVSFGAGTPSTINPRIELSYTLVAQHHARDAVALLEPALVAAAKPDTQPDAVAELHTALADALWQAGGDRARARQLAEQGLAMFTQLGDNFAEMQHRTQAWLHDHPAR